MSILIACSTSSPFLPCTNACYTEFHTPFGCITINICAMYARRDMHSYQIVYMHDGMYIIQSCSTFHDFSVLSAASCSQATVTVLSVLMSLVLTLSLSACTVSAVVHAVMYMRLQRCRAELRGGELCSTPQLSQPLL